MQQVFEDIVIRRMTYLGGPNIWTYPPVLESVIDLGVLEDYPSNKIPGFYERLTSWLPTMIEHRCNLGVRGGFFERVKKGTWPGHIMEHVALELQSLAGSTTGFGRTREVGSERGVYKLIISTNHFVLGKRALERARDLVMAAINDRPFDLPATITELTDLVDHYCLGPSTGCIVDAATERHIPSIRLNDGNLVQLGYGAAQHRIWTAETDGTSAIGEEISRDKALTKRLLAEVGVPIPEGQPAANAAEAWAAAQDIGVPVTVKPLDGNHARGVSLNLTTEAQVAAAFATAQNEGSGVIVERYIEGDEHRLLVVGDKVVAATRGELVCVQGDGHSTVRELIDTHVNTDPRRGDAEAFPLDPLHVESPVLQLILQSQGLTGDSVPPATVSVIVQRTGNMDIDATDDVHPDVAAQAVLAARTVGLDVAGIDLVARDIRKPLGPQKGAIVEVNAGPGLLMHLKPVQGKPEPVGQAIVAHMFGATDDGRVPVVGILAASSGALTAQLLADMLQMHGWPTGLACHNGLQLDGRKLRGGDAADFDNARMLLFNRNVQAIVLETTARRIVTQGLPYDRCQVGIVLAMPTPRGLDDWYFTEQDQMPRIARTQIDVVLPEGTAILNADDADVRDLAQYSDGEVIYVSTQPQSTFVTNHRFHGGRAVFLREGEVILAASAEETSLGHVKTAALTAQTAAGSVDRSHPILAASAAAWALGVAPRIIRAALLHLDGTQPTA